MKLVKYASATSTGVGLLGHDRIVPLEFGDQPYRALAEVLDAEDVAAVVDELAAPTDAVPVANATLLAPIDHQEVWAAGVTYQRSQAARMEESEAAASCYDRVYVAQRPELFFKATPHRVVGPEQPVRIPHDSNWCVPEPEVALVLNSRLELVGYTVGNDVSCRDIEGENPLYLPQAKIYDQCCSLGPCITLAPAMPATETIGIRLVVRREGTTILDESTSLGKMARPFSQLIDYLGRDRQFPQGAFLLTGTGIVPDSHFTLARGDTVEIEIDGIGVLTNTVVQD